jgi:hypothetical protein
MIAAVGVVRDVPPDTVLAIRLDEAEQVEMTHDRRIGVSLRRGQDIHG